MEPNEFTVGSRYRNRIQGYEVLEIKDGKLRARYDDGTEGWVELDMAARICSNIDREEAQAIPGKVDPAREGDFGWTLGVLAKHGELAAEVPPQSWKGFCRDYSSATGITDVANEPGVSQIAEGGWNKWGSELRIYVPIEFTKDARFTLPKDVSLVSGNGPDVMRINKNDFWWHLVERLGFRSGRQQNIAAIEAKLPTNLRESFRSGAS